MMKMKDLLPSWTDYPQGRLFSLDLLRGLDMFLLTVIGPLVVAAQTGWKCFPEPFYRQFFHGWEGFVLWDIIMPLFIFMCGAAMPFALRKRLQEGPGAFWKHVLGRVALLWFLGGLVQGHWAELNPNTFTPYSNTLQSIAIGYLAVAAAMTIRSRAVQIAIPVAMTVLYTVLLAFGGDYSQFGNFAYRIDHAALSALLPADNAFVVRPSHYTWFLTSLMFAVMTFAGYFATLILIGGGSQWRKAGWLFAYGAVLLALGYGSAPWIPIIKPIYTTSCTALAMGWCVISLAVLYVITDIWMFRRGTSLLLLFGQYALTAYFVSHFFAPVLSAASHLIGDGFISYLPKSSSGFALKALELVLLVLVMLVWRRLKSCGEVKK